MEILYKLYISSNEQSGYHTVAKSSESYRVSIKGITVLEKVKKDQSGTININEEPTFYLSTLKYQHKIFVLIF